MGLGLIPVAHHSTLLTKQMSIRWQPLVDVYLSAMPQSTMILGRWLQVLSAWPAVLRVALYRMSLRSRGRLGQCCFLCLRRPLLVQGIPVGFTDKIFLVEIHAGWAWSAVCCLDVSRCDPGLSAQVACQYATSDWLVGSWRYRVCCLSWR